MRTGNLVECDDSKLQAKEQHHLERACVLPVVFVNREISHASQLHIVVVRICRMRWEEACLLVSLDLVAWFSRFSMLRLHRLCEELVDIAVASTKSGRIALLDDVTLRIKSDNMICTV